MKPPLFLASLFVISAILPASAASLILQDSFTDGDRTNGADPLDGAFYKNSSAGTISVVSNELRISTTSTSQAFVGVLPSSATLAIGDSIELSFSFRYLTAPGTAASGFRFGLYNSNGETVSADTTVRDAANSGNASQGYYLSVSTGSGTASNSFFREAGGTDGILAGTDRSSAVGTDTNNLGLDDTDTHTALLRITRTAAGVSLSGSIDSFILTGGTANLSSPNYATIDQVAFSLNNTNIVMALDDITVTYLPVPEPSAALLGLGSLVALLARRRK